MTILSKPSAVYVYEMEGIDEIPGLSIYRVTGGAYDGSDVSAETLVKLGISVPSREKAAA